MAIADAPIIYVSDQEPGFGRRRCGRGFSYFDAKGKLIRQPSIRQRIEALVIPPAWNDVWICPIENGHLQVTGRDDKLRKVYRYHEHYRAIRDQLKFHRLAVFGAALPEIRRHVDAGLRRPQLDQQRVTAIAVRLLDSASLRVGNDAYTQQNKSFGLTTLCREHVQVKGKRVMLSFIGKSGKQRAVRVSDPRLARAATRLSELPGHRLLQYQDASGNVHPIGSTHVNAFLERVTGLDLSAKDFRTWAGTVIASAVLQAAGAAEDEKQTERNIVHAVKTTAGELGNTPAVCRKYYIHPMVFEGYRAGWLNERLDAAIAGIVRPKRHHMTPIEAAVLSLLLDDDGIRQAA